ncbi:unnamed protein product [Owenia fusiformis]|uniref:Uncharacterized protein n=1 Tax=Owenia fusiformis TaxID=6347 RepID=A0A8S4N9X1_OWEFU|nr:unnamed protein product [Owenia fusiformis]
MDPEKKELAEKDLEKGACTGVSNPAFDGPSAIVSNGIPDSKDVEDDVSEDTFDPWELVNPKVKEKKWKELSSFGKFKRVMWLLARLVILLALLYLFICSLDFLSNAFKLLGGKSAGQVFSQNSLLRNPVCGLMLGVLGTVLLQSSSTTTSIIVTMVAESILDVQTAIPIIMGANIGTSVTNTIVSMGQITEVNEFRRAFGGATVHDMFNWLTVFCLLPIEAICAAFEPYAHGGPLYWLTRSIVDSLHIETAQDVNKELLKVITKPFTKLVISIDSKAITKISTGEVLAEDVKLVKHCKDAVMKNVTVNGTTSLEEVQVIRKCALGEAKSLFALTDWSDELVGGILLVVALVLLCICLVLIVKTLHSLLSGHIAVAIKKVVNANFPGKLAFLTGYLAIVVGAGLTILVQSSSIFTSAITPLVGIGVLKIDRMYPLTLGANIGTTFTAILASLTQSSTKLKLALHIAFCHLFFNIIGIIIWYPIPAMRRVPIKLAKFLGNKTAKYRWFAIVYLILMFFLFPAFIFAISIPGWEVLVGVGVPILVFIIVIAIINCMQSRHPNRLPKKLRNWDFLPICLHSLAPYDRIFRCCKCPTFLWTVFGGRRL